MSPDPALVPEPSSSPALAVQHALARIAALHRDLAAAHEQLAANLATALESARAPALMEPMNANPPLPEILTATQLADLLQIDQRTLRAWRHLGDAPPGVQVGSRTRWRREDVEAWLAERGGAR